MERIRTVDEEAAEVDRLRLEEIQMATEIALAEILRLKSEKEELMKVKATEQERLRLKQKDAERVRLEEEARVTAKPAE